MSIPAKQRRIIEAIFESYGKHITMVMDENAPPDKLFLIEGAGPNGGPVMKGGVRVINWARDIRDNAFVPECYDDAASTWA
jgi:hypothetical protein